MSRFLFRWHIKHALRLFQALANWVPGHAKPLSRPRFFGYAHFALSKTKLIINLQVFSRIGKTMKKWQWISNTIMNTNLLATFRLTWHIWWRQNCFICIRIGKHLTYFRPLLHLCRNQAVGKTPVEERHFK